METNFLKHDVQAETEGFHKIPIRKVGVRNMLLPLGIAQKYVDHHQPVVATISTYCGLNESAKGINMSRNSRTLTQCLSKLELTKLNITLAELAQAHNSDEVYLNIKFDYLIEEESPITNIRSYEPCKVEVMASLIRGSYNCDLKVINNQSSCCPCSKNMSLLTNNITPYEAEVLNNIKCSSLVEKIEQAGFGAHNQRSEIQITVSTIEGGPIIWIEDLVDISANAASSPTYTVLKREDEKFVTEMQYLGGYFDETGVFNKIDTAGPKFVEDIARDAANQLNLLLEEGSIKDYIVVVNNEESIHTSLLATAVIDAGLKLK
jgi:GTP cyclohydrolase I